MGVSPRALMCITDFMRAGEEDALHFYRNVRADIYCRTAVEEYGLVYVAPVRYAGVETVEL